jgi:hypothetical protein
VAVVLQCLVLDSQLTNGNILDASIVGMLYPSEGLLYTIVIQRRCKVILTIWCVNWRMNNVDTSLYNKT